VSLLNLHEDERSKPRNWIPVGWIPVYDESRDKRPNKGFDSTSARKIRLYHQCWIEFLDKWAERTKEAILLPWADGVDRLTRIFIGGVMGDQQEGDKFTGEPCVCHRCFAPRKRYLDTADFEAKTMRKVRQRVEIAAAGGYLTGRHNSTRVVKWDPDGRNVRPGPGIISLILIIHLMYIISNIVYNPGVRYYESQRLKAGAHLFFNAFWLIPNFCINQMYMRDPMHQIDSGVIISFLKAVLRKFRECVEFHLGIPGAAAKKLTDRLRRLLGKEKIASGHVMHGAHACLVPVNYATTNVFKQLEDKQKAARNTRSCDYRHLMLLLPFCLSNLFREEVEEHNSTHQGAAVVDPSEELINVTNVFLRWYKLYRQTTPGKTAADITLLRSLSLRYVSIMRIIHIIVLI